MDYQTILTPERTLCLHEPVSKKQLLEAMSTLMAAPFPDIETHEILALLIARERLGSTAIGHGVAIPHARTKHCHQEIGALIKTNQGISYDAADEQPVDLFFGLLVPQETQESHLQLLANLANSFNDVDFRNSLRQAKDGQSLYQIMVEHE